MPFLIEPLIVCQSHKYAKYANHPSIKAIKSKPGINSHFELNPIVEGDMIKEILALNPSKSMSGSIPIKALKLGVFECLRPLLNSSMIILSLTFVSHTVCVRLTLTFA